MKRGEIWTASAGSGHVGKPRAVVIVQDGRFDATASVTVCAFTTDPTDAPLIRLLVEADEITGIREPSRLMVDKITTIPREAGRTNRSVERRRHDQALACPRGVPRPRRDLTNRHTSRARNHRLGGHPHAAVLGHRVAADQPSRPTPAC